MSKAFDKVWYQGLIFKIKSTGVSDSLLSLTESFLCNRFLRVQLNVQMSERLPVKASPSQGSWHSLITIFKSFMRPHLDHGIIIYDQPINESFIQKFESTQYMLPFQLQVSSKEHLKVSCTVNLVLNL